jgi:DNA-directed RNA polymerase specialized sigma24 family protein
LGRFAFILGSGSRGIDCAAGARPERREAYTSYSGTLYRFALGYSGSEARAAEAVQEVFLDLLRNPAPSVTIKDER